MRKIPRTMSTQHPDNATLPFFSESPQLSGDDEVEEAYYVFSHLGVEEQMWDCEGKEVDAYVVNKLLTRYPEFFKENVLGKDVFLTLRVPNPDIERAEAKFLLETLESIPRSYDTAKVFYGSTQGKNQKPSVTLRRNSRIKDDEKDWAPIFEVILPMTTSARQLGMITEYYSRFVAGKEEMKIGSYDITVGEWIGEIFPKEIEIIPLVEDADHLINIDKLITEYIERKNPEYLRVFLARSDPALNYGLIPAALLVKLALYKLEEVEKKTGVKIYPIVGAGSVPFRGHLTPYTFEEVVREYRGCQTFTIQSAFKYDNPPRDVVRAIEKINRMPKEKASEVPEKEVLKIVNKGTKAYQEAIPLIASVVNEVSRFVPSRRLRKLHVGLFGYARSVKGVHLPRAITYCAALYSVGLPPELIGLNAFDKKEFEFIESIYPFYKKDLTLASSFFNPHCEKLFGKEILKHIFIPDGVKPNQEHLKATSRIIDSLLSGGVRDISKRIIEAAHIRKFLG